MELLEAPEEGLIRPCKVNPRALGIIRPQHDAFKDQLNDLSNFREGKAE